MEEMNIGKRNCKLPGFLRCAVKLETSTSRVALLVAYLATLIASLLACRPPTSALPAAVEAEALCEYRGGSKAVVARPWPRTAVVLCSDGSRWEVR